MKRRASQVVLRGIWRKGTEFPWEEELEVLRVGEGITDIEPGDRVVLEPYRGDVMDWEGETYVRVKRQYVLAKVSGPQQVERVGHPRDNW